MPLKFYPSVYATGRIPFGWLPIKGGTLKYPVRNPAVLQELRRLQIGKWSKVIKRGTVGEIHYFEHESGGVAGVKFYHKIGQS